MSLLAKLTLMIGVAALQPHAAAPHAPGQPHAGAGTQQLARPSLGKGVLLIAKKDLPDPNFHQTVILITYYGEDGTTGLIINRALPVPAQEVLPDLARLPSDPGQMHMGGPVAMGSLQLLVRADRGMEASEAILSGVYAVSRPAVLESLASGDVAYSGIRLFAGYAGWAAGQLESELLRGDWFLWQGNAETVFSSEPEQLWPDLFAKVSAQWVRLPDKGRQGRTLPGSQYNVCAAGSGSGTLLGPRSPASRECELTHNVRGSRLIP